LVGFLGAFAIVAGCGLSDDSQKRAQIDCLNHLKQLGVSVLIDANDHEDTIPRDFLFLTNHTISPAVLLCAMDPARKGRAVSAPEQQLSPAQLSATNISYQLVSPGAKLIASNYQALVRCPFHRQVSYVEGSQIKAKSEQSRQPVADVPVQPLQAGLTPHLTEAVKPARLSPGELQQELTRRLSREELALVVNPIEINSAMKHWAREIASSATNDAQRVRSLFEALANRARSRGQGGTRTAQEVFVAWGDREQSFSCQETARLYLGLARELGIESYYVHLEKDDEGKPVSHDHDCAIVFLKEGAWLVDPTHHGFGVSHKQFKVLNDLEMTAHHAMQWRNDGRNVARCQVGLKLHPGFAWAHLALAKALVMEDRAAEALPQIERALTLEANRWDAYLIRGMVSGRNGDPSRARLELEKAHSLNPENPEIHFRLGEAFVDLRQWEVALESFRAALRYDDQYYHDEVIERARENIAEIEETLAAVSGQTTALAKLRNKAEAGDPVAQNNLALYLSKQPNPEFSEIVKWLSLAANQGYAPAQFGLGNQYVLGNGVEMNPEKALDWYHRAAEQDHPEALYRLAVMYFQGKGVAADPQAGLKWGRRAAECGHAKAQFALGMDYYEGELLKQDFVEAHKWVSLAKRSGYSEANPLLREIELFMTPEQITQSQMQVQEWKVKTSPQPQPRPSQPSQ
jgi:TPR repeat protein/transglutaminase-like putative cysteine protease